MKSVTLENIFEGVYSLFQVLCIWYVHDSFQEEVFLKFILCPQFAELQNKMK